jgi:hypothetical protein
MTTHRNNPGMFKILPLFTFFVALNLMGAHAQTESTWETPSAQSAKPVKTLDIVKADLDSSIHDGVSLVTAPLRFGWKEWTGAALCVGATGVAALEDSKARTYAQSHKTDGRGDIILPWKYYSSGYTALAIGVGAYSCGLVFSNPWWRETGREVLTALAISGATGEVLKIGVGRFRPYTDKGDRAFNPFSINDQSASFPSGHTLTAFTVSSVLARRIDNPYVSCGLYGIALLTGVERIYSDNHWLSDVVFGAILGTVIGRSVAHSDDDVIHGGKKLSWQIDPDISLSSIGLTLKTDF